VAAGSGHQRFNWKTLSVIVGLTLWNFYFQIFENTIGSEQVIEFLTHLLRHIPANCSWSGTACPPTAAG
jgi:hypothetical protein